MRLPSGTSIEVEAGDIVCTAIAVLAGIAIFVMSFGALQAFWRLLF